MEFVAGLGLVLAIFLAMAGGSILDKPKGCRWNYAKFLLRRIGLWRN
ncbi:MAG: hypothetical protein AAB847_02485 [Patescibacteria group bacterium]